jgi:NitT/TauT family transport system substrate-binding protein
MAIIGTHGINRRLFAQGTAGLALLAGLPRLARAADTKMIVAFTPTAAAAGIFNAQGQGFFAKQGLSSDLLLQRNSVGVAAAVQSDAAQIGAAAAGVFFGAVQHGLDYVALGCQSLFGPGTDVLAVLVRNGVEVKQPGDFVGKRIGIPGLNGGTHVTFLEWLREKGVDRTKVNFVEVNYPQQADILRGKTIDAVVTSEPYLARIVSAGLGTVFSHLNDIKRNIPDAFFMAKREWVVANPQAAAGFQAALKQGVAFARADQAQSDENTAKYLKQDVAIVKQAGKQNYCDDDVAKHINELNDVMTGLGLAPAPLDATKVAWHP